MNEPLEVKAVPARILVTKAPHKASLSLHLLKSSDAVRICGNGQLSIGDYPNQVLYDIVGVKVSGSGPNRAPYLQLERVDTNSEVPW
jgi:hypothetical protein